MSFSSMLDFTGSAFTSSMASPTTRTISSRCRSTSMSLVMGGLSPMNRSMRSYSGSRIAGESRPGSGLGFRGGSSFPLPMDPMGPSSGTRKPGELINSAKGGFGPGLHRASRGVGVLAGASSSTALLTDPMSRARLGNSDST